MRKEKLEELKGYIEEFKTRKVEELENPGFLTIHKRLYTLQNGKQVTREILKKNKKDGSAAIILPLTKDLETILVIEPRVATKEGVGISLPAGYIEEGEDPVVAAQRELREETGFEASHIEEICSYYQDEGISGAFNHSFIAYDVEQKHEQDLDKDEFIKYFKCTYEEALELVELGYINGANSILTLEKSKQYIRR